MSEWRDPFHIRIEDGDVTEREAEAYAQGLYDALQMAGIYDGHCKSYDPLVIAERVEPKTLSSCPFEDLPERPNPRAGERYLEAHTYVFDLWDGGRHHELTGKSLAYLCKFLRAETAWDFRNEGWSDKASCDAFIKTVEYEPFDRRKVR